MRIIFNSDGDFSGVMHGGTSQPGGVEAPAWYMGQPVYLADGAVVAYTAEQAAAKAARPAYPARWSNAEMQWQDLRSMSDLRYLRTAAIKRARADAEGGTFIVAGRTFQSDEASLKRLQIAIMAASAAGAGWTTEWTLADNTEVTMTKAQMLAVAAGLYAHIKAQRDTAKALRAAVDAAATVADVEAVSWPAA